MEKDFELSVKNATACRPNEKKKIRTTMSADLWNRFTIIVIKITSVHSEIDNDH